MIGLILYAMHEGVAYSYAPERLFNVPTAKVMSPRVLTSCMCSSCASATAAGEIFYDVLDARADRLAYIAAPLAWVAKLDNLAWDNEYHDVGHP